MTKPKAKRPDTVKVAPFTVTIEVDPRLTENHSIMGHWAGDAGRITIDGNLNTDAEADTVLHEVLHAVWSQTYLDRQYSAEQEEEVIWTLTPRLLSLIRDNPDMVRWLQDVGSKSST